MHSPVGEYPVGEQFYTSLTLVCPFTQASIS